jgi:hypothetical protein
LRRTLEEARRGEANRKGSAQEERRLASGELRRGGHQLLEILLPQRIGEMLDLTGGAVDVFRNLRLVLTAHLAAGVMEGRGDRIEGAGQPLLLGAELGGELRGRLLASGVDELTGLFLGLADDLGSLLRQTATARAAAHRAVSALGAGPSSRHAGAGCPGPRLLAACRFP